MDKRKCPKWKTITVYDEDTKKVVHYELDDNEKLMFKDKIKKKVPNIIKQISLNNDGKNDCSFNHMFRGKKSMVISKNMIIISCESVLDLNTLNVNSDEMNNNIMQKKMQSNANGIQIMDFHQVESMINNEFEKWENFYLFK